MRELVIVLRVVHIVGGIFWVGALLFNTFFLGPAVRDAGPAGGAVMGALMKRKLPVIMPIIGLAAILSGVWLYYINSVGFQTAYLRSHPGMVFGIGGIFAILALAIGAAVLAPAMQKAVALSQQAGQAPAGEKEALLAKAQALRERAGKASAVATTFAALAAVAMAVARYTA